MLHTMFYEPEIRNGKQAPGIPERNRVNIERSGRWLDEREGMRRPTSPKSKSRRHFEMWIER